MQYFVYAIVSLKDGRIYVGMSVDPIKRLKEHNSKKTKSTKGFTTWKLFFTKEVADRTVARKEEKYFKSGIGKEKLKSILKSAE